jgi:hypothetical protein
MDWETNTVQDNPQYGQAINSKLVEIANNNDLIQMVTELTRGNNIRQIKQIHGVNQFIITRRK